MAAGRDVDGLLYGDATKAVNTPGKFKALADGTEFREAQEFARAQLQAFHWDLAFPEVFCDANGVRPGGGFDAIIGNPPYEVLSAKESSYDPTDLKTFVGHESLYKPAVRGKQNLYKLFICRGIDLLKDRGRFGFIAPMALLGDDQAADLRRHMIAAGDFVGIEAFPQKDSPKKRVFEDAKLSTTVFAFAKGKDANPHPFKSRVHPEKTVIEDSPALTLTADTIPLYDPANFTIVSCAQDDWDLATRIIKSRRMSRLQEHAEFFQGEVNETNERANGTLVSECEGKLVIRGASVCLYLARSASQGTDLFLNANAFTKGKGADTKAFHHVYPRVVWQESSPQNNFRRIIAGMLPANEFCNHTINYLPEHLSALPLAFICGLLNSVLSDWYFRLGSTNAHVSHYQICNLPCPVFRSKPTTKEAAIGKKLAELLADSKPESALPLLAPLLETAPFSPVLIDTVVLAVDRIVEAEKRRGSMSRSDRSALSSKAQPFQDFLDELFFAMAGLSPEEVVGLRSRYEQMN